MEFSDYRDYVPGDDVRFLDWNAFARLNRPYLRLYRREEVSHVVVLVDASSSMLFEGKLLMARRLGAAFGLMGLLGGERVSACVFNSASAPQVRFRPSSGRAHMGNFFSFMEGIEGGGDAPLEDGIESFLKLHTGRGVVLVLSDFLTFGDLNRAFNLLFGTGLEIFAVQILAPAEVEPDISGDASLVDCETKAALDVSFNSDLLDLYQEYRNSFQNSLAQSCRRRAGRFLPLVSDQDTGTILFDVLRRKGWIE
jgi:uncharacterized protein (DUF58 family)